jgi:malate dehydrogenase (oxaloacetate-decarboxylating)
MRTLFPGVGLGTIAVKARHISEGMFLAASRAIADMSPARPDRHANLLQPLAESRTISLQVANAVGEQAISDYSPRSAVKARGAQACLLWRRSTR